LGPFKNVAGELGTEDLGIISSNSSLSFALMKPIFRFDSRSRYRKKFRFFQIFPGRGCDFSSILAEKICDFDPKIPLLYTKFNHNIGFQENRQFLRKNGQNRRKL
jgi:hypothetical protein